MSRWFVAELFPSGVEDYSFYVVFRLTEALVLRAETLKKVAEQVRCDIRDELGELKDLGVRDDGTLTALQELPSAWYAAWYDQMDSPEDEDAFTEDLFGGDWVEVSAQLDVQEADWDDVLTLDSVRLCQTGESTYWAGWIDGTNFRFETPPLPHLHDTEKLALLAEQE